LRGTLHAGLVDRVPLDQELQLLECYVDIQRARFGDRLKVNVSVAADAPRTALVPSLLLQPLVENAIKHGIGARVGACRIDITISRTADSVLIEIKDDGRGLGGDVIREGVGLGNCRSRLDTIYGARHHLSIANGDGGGAIVRIVLPLEIAAVS
jgi:two-component system, LytTR family, sensor kinase